MKLRELCPLCGGTITVTVRLADRAHADTILAAFRQVHNDTCPTPARPSGWSTRVAERAAREQTQ